MTDREADAAVGCCERGYQARAAAVLDSVLRYRVYDSERSSDFARRAARAADVGVTEKKSVRQGPSHDANATSDFGQHSSCCYGGR